MRNSLCLFKVLPNELVSNILAMLGYRDLASCMKVRGPSVSSFLNGYRDSRRLPLWVLTGVQAHARSDWHFLFTAVPPRTGKIRYGGRPSEHNVDFGA